MIKLIVFDWNSVLIADVQACLDANNQIFTDTGVKPISKTRFKETFQIPALDFFEKNGGSRNYMIKNSFEFAIKFHKIYEGRVKKVRTRKGVKSALEFFSKKNIKTIILSNHTMEGIKKQLIRLRIKKYFSKIIGNSIKTTSLNNRNKGDKLKDFLTLNNTKNEEVIIVGDSTEEIEIAKKLGLTSVAITGGYYSTKRLKVYKPDFLINKIEEFKKIIKNQYL